MRSDHEVHHAIALLGASLVGGEMRRFVWGPLGQEEGRAWAMFGALGWVAGADDTDFARALEYAALKMQEYIEQEKEKNNYAQ